MSNNSITGRYSATGTVLAVAALSVAVAATVPCGPSAGVAHGSPVPASISADSPVADVLRFAEASGAHWRTLSVEGRTRSGGVDRPFRISVARDGRCRAEDGSDLRIRSGRRRLQTDREGGPIRRFAVPELPPTADRALQARMAAHRANDPTLTRDGEVLIDTPVNDLISPARIVRKELGLTATSVTKEGTATVAGREAVVLEARFPAELAKEDHWDVYVDIETGVLLGLVIEPLPGGDRYEMFVDSLSVDPVLPETLFDCDTDPTG